MKNNYKILSLIPLIISLFFLIPNISFAIYCRGNSSSNVGEYAGTSCPLGTHLATNEDLIASGLAPSPTPTQSPEPTPAPSQVKPAVISDENNPNSQIQSTPAVVVPIKASDVALTPSADVNSGSPNGGGPLQSSPSSGPCVPIVGFIPSDECIRQNGLGALAGMVNKIIKWFVGMSATIAAITFSIAGAKMLMNPESESERQAAKEMFKKTVIGLIIIIGAWLLVTTIISALVKTDTGALRFLSK